MIRFLISTILLLSGIGCAVYSDLMLHGGVITSNGADDWNTLAGILFIAGLVGFVYLYFQED